MQLQAAPMSRRRSPASDGGLKVIRRSAWATVLISPLPVSPPPPLRSPDGPRTEGRPPSHPRPPSHHHRKEEARVLQRLPAEVQLAGEQRSSPEEERKFNKKISEMGKTGNYTLGRQSLWSQSCCPSHAYHGHIYLFGFVSFCRFGLGENISFRWIWKNANDIPPRFSSLLYFVCRGIWELKRSIYI